MFLGECFVKTHPPGVAHLVVQHQEGFARPSFDHFDSGAGEIEGLLRRRNGRHRHLHSPLTVSGRDSAGLLWGRV